jgi:hypothetical protein
MKSPVYILACPDTVVVIGIGVSLFFFTRTTSILCQPATFPIQSVAAIVQLIGVLISGKIAKPELCLSIRKIFAV